MKKTKVLFLSAWYPHRYDAMEGLFVQKHAWAASRYTDVCVLFLLADKNITDYEIVTNKNQGVLETIVYYPKRVGLLRKIVTYFRAFQKGYTHVLSNWGKPKVTHAHILTRTGFLAYLLKKKYGIPYIITEQWSRYLPEKRTYTGFLRKYLTRLVVRNAEYLLPVSQTLADAMQCVGLQAKRTICVGNVVDDFFYVPQEKQPRTKRRILHVSCFDESAKNIRGILRAVQRLSDERFDFELIIIGTGPDFKQIHKEAQNLMLNSVIRFVGEQTPQQVSDWMHQSDFFVLFSNYETFATVIPEALASGIPVVSSQVGIAPQLVTQETGILVSVGDEDGLYSALQWMLNNFQNFDSEKLRQYALPFSSQQIGLQLRNCYKSATVRS